MALLEDLKPGVKVKGIIPEQVVTIVEVKWHGSTAIELFYKRPDGQPGTQLLYRDNENTLEIVHSKRSWSFNADGDIFRLVSEAYRIHLAHLFDPVLAVHTSLIEPLPHQITGVYGEMLLRQPLRFLLADDPGAGKTIMAGLLIKELNIRGDVRRCLICVPGNLAAQWQDEMWFKFQLHFEVPAGPGGSEGDADLAGVDHPIEDTPPDSEQLNENSVQTGITIVLEDSRLQLRLSPDLENTWQGSTALLLAQVLFAGIKSRLDLG